MCNPTSPTQLAVTTNRLEGLAVFFVDTNGSLFYSSQTATGSWGTPIWLRTSRAVSKLAVTENKDERLEIFYTSTDNRIYHNVQTDPRDVWAGETCDTAEYYATQLALAQNTIPEIAGMLELFYIGVDKDKQIYHRWQTTPGDGWSHQQSLDGACSPDVPLAIGQNADGRLEVFFIGTQERYIWHCWYDASTPTNWSSPWPLDPQGKPASALVVGRDAGGQMEVFNIGDGEDTRIYHNWQKVPSGAWNGQEVFKTPQTPQISAKVLAVPEVPLVPRKPSLGPLVYTDMDDVLYYSWFGQTDWTDPKQFGPQPVRATALAVGQGWGDLLYVIYIDMDRQQLYYISQQTVGQDSWNPPEVLLPQG